MSSALSLSTFVLSASPEAHAYRTESPARRIDHGGRSPGRSSRQRRDLKLDVLDALAGSGYAALGYVHCEIESNQVVLRGTVPSYHLKQLAQVHAQRVAGVDRIDNRLEVHKRPKS